MSARTRGVLVPLRAHEDTDGPYFDIEPDEQADYDARPFVRLATTEGETVATAHDLFEFKPGDAERLVLCWNAMEHMDDATVTRLAAYLGKYNADELDQMLTESGV